MMQQHSVVHFNGGLDLINPISRSQPGVVRGAKNMEADDGGYRRVVGYERFDGRLASSEGGDRALIEAVPGNGPVTGVFQSGASVYAWRNNADDSATIIYKASAMGWQVITHPALGPNARVKVLEYNFYGSPDKKRLYIVDGVNPVYEINPFTDAVTVIKTDTESFAQHIAAFNNQLFVSYVGGSLQFSDVGTPDGWDPANALGAGEIAIGADITNLQETAAGSLLITSEGKAWALTGTDIDNFNLDLITDDLGAEPHCLSSMGAPFAWSDSGLISFARVQEHGGWRAATPNRLADPILKLRSFTDAMQVRGRNVIRFFTGSVHQISVFFPVGAAPQIMPIEFPHVMTAGYTCKDEQGKEQVYACGADGFVYHLERGTSFDGQPIEWFVNPIYFGLGSPTVRKSFRRVELSIMATEPVSLFVAASLDYGTERDSAAQTQVAQSGGGLWNAAVWNEFIWSAGSLANPFVSIEGTGRNISLTIAGSSDREESFTLSSATIFYLPRRQTRGK